MLDMVLNMPLGEDENYFVKSTATSSKSIRLQLRFLALFSTENLTTSIVSSVLTVLLLPDLPL